MMAPMTDDEMREFVLGCCDGRIFTAAHLRQGELDLVPTVFMPLALGAKVPEDVGNVYEYMDKAGRQSVNGYPVFFSCRFISKADWDKARALIKFEIDRRKSISVEIP